jgi:outer membrane scaffolding protein for murein synthesis (MipA/OmpV family)
MKSALVPFGLCLASLAPGARAQDEEPPPRYVVGAAVSNHSAYTGATERKSSLTPVWALQWGKWRLTGPGGAGLLGFGREAIGQGAGRELVQTQRWRAGITLRIDTGRKSADAETTQGLPDVRTTLRGRFYTSYRITPDWDVTAALTPDLLGHGGGTLFNAGLGWRLYKSSQTEWTTGWGATWGNGQYQRSYFGVPTSAATSTRPVYQPGAGWRELGLGLGFTHRLAPDWLLFGSGSLSHLAGPTASSPLVQRRNDGALSLGLAWRN